MKKIIASAVFFMSAICLCSCSSDNDILEDIVPASEKTEVTESVPEAVNDSVKTEETTAAKKYANKWRMGIKTVSTGCSEEVSGKIESMFDGLEKCDPAFSVDKIYARNIAFINPEQTTEYRHDLLADGKWYFDTFPYGEGEKLFYPETPEIRETIYTSFVSTMCPEIFVNDYDAQCNNEFEVDITDIAEGSFMISASLGRSGLSYKDIKRIILTDSEGNEIPCHTFYMDLFVDAVNSTLFVVPDRMWLNAGEYTLQVNDVSDSFTVMTCSDYVIYSDNTDQEQ